MFVQLSKAALARVLARNLAATSHKCPKFSHHRSAEKGKLSEAPPTVSTSTALAVPSIIDLEVALETMPKFDECVVDLLHYLPSWSSKNGKEKDPPSLLQDEDQAIVHLCLVLFDGNMESFKGTSSGVLAKSTFYNLAKVRRYFVVLCLVSFILFSNIYLLSIRC